MLKKVCKAAFPHTIPVLMGYLFLGMAFGILLESKGFHTGWALLMGTTIYAGSMQFVGTSILAVAMSFGQTAIVTLLVNARHLFYGLSMIEKYKDTGKVKPYLIFALTDETYSLVSTLTPPEDIPRKWFYFFISLFNQLYWIVGCVLGTLIGGILPFVPEGIEFVMTALFVVIAVEQWCFTKKHIPAITGFIVSGICLILFGAENFLIPSMIGIIVVLSIGRRHLEGGKENGA